MKPVNDKLKLFPVARDNAPPYRDDGPPYRQDDEQIARVYQMYGIRDTCRLDVPVTPTTANEAQAIIALIAELAGQIHAHRGNVGDELHKLALRTRRSITFTQNRLDSMGLEGKRARLEVTLTVANRHGSEAMATLLEELAQSLREALELGLEFFEETARDSVKETNTIGKRLTLSSKNWRVY